MIILDTHVLLWWVSGSDSLSVAANKVIKRTLTKGSEIIISSISAWEISMLISKGRLMKKLSSTNL
jgi:PIN domain nuclease of toxin-antitoxin system